ncbi:MAG TPA: peptidylprolyl isomerase [Rhizomicrobium sp.]|nr:peptidylprolyl isomerase [Rhizomicrobium sp.]
MRLALILGFTALIAASPLGAAPPASTANDWRDVDPDNLVLIDTRYGEVAVELAPEFAPNHVARLRALVRSHFFDGKSFYRVIDGFVAQGGVGEGTASTKGLGHDAKMAKDWPPLKAEFDVPAAQAGLFTPLGSPDLFAPEVGHVNGFPVARDMKDGKAWIAHCPGTFAFARDNANDTATTEFYVVIGEMQRRLDRNLTAFGRVIDGMQYLQKLNRGNPDVDSGVIQNPKDRDPILRVRLASDLPESVRPHFQVMRTDSAAFAAKKAQRLNPAPQFYHRKPPQVLDLCNTPVPVRKLEKG